VSIFAHSVDDAATCWRCWKAPTPTTPTAPSQPGPATLPATLRIGVPAAVDLDADHRLPRAWTAALQRLRDEGHTLVPIDFTPLHEVAALLYDGPWVAERHAVVQDLLARNPDALDPTVRRVIARALGFCGDRHLPGPVPLQELPGAAGRAVGAGRPAAGAHRAHATPASTRSTPTRWA
jgi:allophanate hydrolase